MHRDGNGRWLVGQSGNLAGRPVVLRSVRELARVHTLLAIDTLADVARARGEHASARIAAARELLDRAHGRTPVADDDRRALAELSDDELGRLIEDERQQQQRERDDAAGVGSNLRRDERECDDEEEPEGG